MNGEINWPANLYNDWDQDGCNDLLEDSDDDNDGELDATDGCPKGRSNWQSERTMNTDFDMDGCYDATEDVDDDNDNVNDVNATGATLDLCPTRRPMQRMLMNLGAQPSNVTPTEMASTTRRCM